MVLPDFGGNESNVQCGKVITNGTPKPAKLKHLDATHLK